MGKKALLSKGLENAKNMFSAAIETFSCLRLDFNFEGEELNQDFNPDSSDEDEMDLEF